MSARGPGWTEAASTRLRLLEAAEADLEAPRALRSALQHVVAEFGGLGGMIHLSGLDYPWAELLLAATTEMPQGITRIWQRVSRDGETAPGRAFGDRDYAWVPALADPRPGRAPPSGLLVDTGVAAVALPDADNRPLGTVSALTLPQAEPTPAQRAFLNDAARWVAARLRLLTPPERQAGDVAAIGAWECDLATGEMGVDARVLDALGVADHDGRVDGWLARLHPEDLPWVEAAIHRDLHGRGLVDCACRVRRTDGGYAWVRVRNGPPDAQRDGRPGRGGGSMAVPVHEVTDAGARTLQADARLTIHPDTRIAAMNPQAERLFGPSQGIISRPLRGLPTLGRVPHLAQRCRQALSDRTPVDFTQQAGRRWYRVRLLPDPDGGLTAHITDITDRQRLETAERDAADRARLVSTLIRTLNDAATIKQVVDGLESGLMRPLGATGLAVFTLEEGEEGGELRLLGSTGYPHARLRKRVSGMPLNAHSAISQALRAGIPRFVASREEHTALYPDVADVPDIGNKRAWAFLPLIAGSRPIGVAVLSYGKPHEASQEEKNLLAAISGWIAQAVGRARAVSVIARGAQEANERARRLQDGLLPRTLPELRAVTAAARYLPAPGADVGGDWYDVIPLASDRVALVAGDVMGHGMDEAAAMGRLQSAVRTLSRLEMPPEEILAYLNDIVVEARRENPLTDRFVTCLYGVYDPVSRDFRYASAGHPPPAHVRPDGAVNYPGALPDPPLGTGEPPFSVHSFSVPDESLLVLYTDGLVESPERGIGAGMEHLARVLRGEHAAPLDALCERVTSALLPSGRSTRDDAALLIARTRALPPDDVAVWSLPSDPTAARVARNYVRGQLETWGLDDDDLRHSCEVVVSELAGNVVRHAMGPTKLRMLRTRHVIIIEVSDGSLTTPHIRHPSSTDEGGRGLRLVTAMAHRWGSRHGRTGKTIWVEMTTTNNRSDHFLINLDEISLDDIPEI